MNTAIKFDPADIFTQQDSVKANFLSRIFGVFSEDVVKHWLNNENCPFESLGRPTIYDANDSLIATLDFTMRHKKKKNIYIVEQKCFYGFRKGKLASMSATQEFAEEFRKWSKQKENNCKAWKCFIHYVERKDNYYIKANGKEYRANGAILIWPGFDRAGKALIKKSYGLTDVISLEQIIEDLETWQDEDFKMFISNRKKWTAELFKSLA